MFQNKVYCKGDNFLYSEKSGSHMESKSEKWVFRYFWKISYSEINYLLPTNKLPHHDGSSVEEPSVDILRHFICSDKLSHVTR